MKIIKCGFCTVALALFSFSVGAAPFTHEARSLGMGTIGVTTANISTAPFANPAMLAFQKPDDDFSLSLGIGGFFNDNDGMIDDIDLFQLAYERYQNAEAVGDSAASDAAAVDMLGIVFQLDGKVIAPELSSAIAAGFSGETYAMAVSARTDVIVAGSLSNVAFNIADVVSPSFNILNVSGAKTTEVGFSIARNFDFLGSKVSVGITPKRVSIEAVEYSQSISSADTGLDNLVDNGIQDLGAFTTIDAGLVFELIDNINVGLVVKNLIPKDVSFTAISGGAASLSFDSQLKAGVSFRNDFLTIGADLDLLENDPVLSSAAFSGLKRQNLSMGLEINALDFLQLRAGMVKNIAGGVSSGDKKTLTTLGVGLWLGFNLDIAAMFGAGDSLGGFVQAGFSF